MSSLLVRMVKSKKAATKWKHDAFTVRTYSDILNKSPAMRTLKDLEAIFGWFTAVRGLRHGCTRRPLTWTRVCPATVCTDSKFFLQIAWQGPDHTERSAVRALPARSIDIR